MPIPFSTFRERYSVNYGEKQEEGKPAFYSCYAIAFNTIDPRYSNIFACVGGQGVKVFEVDPEPREFRSQSPSANGGGRGDPLFRLVHEYLDVKHVSTDPDRGERGEEFYTCVWSVAGNGDPLLCFAGKLGIIMVMNYERQEFYNIAQGHGNSINHLASHPTKDGIILSSSADLSIRMWNIRTSTVIAIFAGLEGHNADVLYSDFHSLKDCFASGASDHLVKVWHWRGHEDLLDKSFHWDDQNTAFPTAYVQAPVFSSNIHDSYVDCVHWFGDLLLSKCAKNEIVLWKPEYGEKGVCDCALPLRKFKILNQEDIWFVRFSLNPVNTVISLGDSKGKVYIWDLTTTTKDVKEISKLTLGDKKKHPQGCVIRQTSFSFDSKYLACCESDGTVCLWRF